MENTEYKQSNRLAVVGIIMVAIALRPSLVSIGPALATIKDYFHLSHLAAGLLISIPDMLMGLLALPTPWLARKFGRDRLIIASLVLITGSTFSRALAQNVVSLLACTFGVGAGIAIAGTLLSGFVKANFPTRAAVMMGIYTTALSFGSTLSAITTAPILNATSWRLSIGVWSILGLVAVFAWIAVSNKEKKKDESSVNNVPADIPWKNGIAWRIALFFAGVNLIFYSLVAWTAPLFTEHGLSISSAGYLLGCFTLFFTLSSPIFGSFSKSLDRRKWLFVASLITVTGLSFIAFVPDFFPFVTIAVTAIGLGGAFTLGMTLPLDNTSDAAETNAWTAFILTIGYLIAACGPLTLGAMRDITGNFKDPMLTLVGVAVLMLGLSVSLKPRKLVAKGINMTSEYS